MVCAQTSTFWMNGRHRARKLQCSPSFIIPSQDRQREQHLNNTVAEAECQRRQTEEKRLRKLDFAFVSLTALLANKNDAMRRSSEDLKSYSSRFADCADLRQRLKFSPRMCKKARRRTPTMRSTNSSNTTQEEDEEESLNNLIESLERRDDLEMQRRAEGFYDAGNVLKEFCVYVIIHADDNSGLILVIRDAIEESPMMCEPLLQMYDVANQLLKYLTSSQ
ncbi:hypothetical protein PROFUN_09615 [Planoprotostelium fungivorum]|uniref:Uncharacterized protein n=1 Tax=Planoprotostelium fungivorum TaxID=1890364 RepID=A0A2P6MNY1_9EUKA|nr:hypothetical protein PROFUN_09615 [Planoprotostelium fungivorum]